MISQFILCCGLGPQELRAQGGEGPEAGWVPCADRGGEGTDDLSMFLSTNPFPDSLNRITLEGGV